MSTRKLINIFMVVAILLVPSLSMAQDSNGFSLTIMHTNDTHAHHDPEEDGSGGVARMTTVVRQIRDEVEHSLLLDAGDRFTGSEYHSFYQGWDNVQVMTEMGYDAMVLGSYEFTHGAARLAEFVQLLDFPVVVTNVDFSRSQELAGEISPFIIIEMDGERIGIIGITQGDSRIRPIPELEFDLDYVEVAQAAVDTLNEQGINKIIMLSHLGYFTDLELATQLEGVDVIVGGDSNTLLSNTLPDAEGPYPAVATSASGEPILVVQAAQYNRVLGRLDVTFDDDGVLQSWEGDAIPITADIEPDPVMTILINRLRMALQDTFLVGEIGETLVRLEGERDICRYEECNMGNLITDAMRETTGADIAFQNGGGIRASIDPGPVVAGDVLETLPFSNTFVIFDVSGIEIIEALENSVSRVTSSEGTGRFLQVSGLRYTWDGSQDVGRRIVNVEVLNENGEYETLDPDRIYSVVTNDYVFVGGDDYTMFAENAQDSFDFGRGIEEIVRNYITNNSPIDMLPNEGRITRVDR